jgi:hypothetical protein
MWCRVPVADEEYSSYKQKDKGTGKKNDKPLRIMQIPGQPSILKKHMNDQEDMDKQEGSEESEAHELSSFGKDEEDHQNHQDNKEKGEKVEEKKART